MVINRIFFTGNLTADPELVDLGKNKVVNGTLANNEFYTDESNERQQVTTYLDIKIWGTPA
jgi:single-stranded DNA-binding protein